MAATKFLIIIALATVVANAASLPEQVEVLRAEKPNHLIVGERVYVYADKLYHQENISETASLVGKKVILERTYNVPNNYVITQVRALDQATDGNGAEVAITAGAPGQSSISLRFKSQRFHGIYFSVEVYAKLY